MTYKEILEIISPVEVDDIYFGGWLRDASLFLAGMVCLAELLIGIAYLIHALRCYANMAAFLVLTFFV